MCSSHQLLEALIAQAMVISSISGSISSQQTIVGQFPTPELGLLKQEEIKIIITTMGLRKSH